MKKTEKNEYINLIPKETAVIIAESIAVMVLLDQYFFQSYVALLPLALVGVGFFLIKRRELYEKKRQMAREEFKELMLLSGTGQRAGYSVENSIINSYQDLQKLYGDKSFICLLVRKISVAKKNNRSIANVFIEIGSKCRIEEIRDFGFVYQIAYSHSGNMSAVMDKCANTLIDKMEVQSDISMSLNEKVTEMKIMSVMPFLLMTYIKLTNPGYFEGMYESVMGVAIMTICLGIYIFSYWWSNRIVSIEV